MITQQITEKMKVITAHDTQSHVHDEGEEASVGGSHSRLHTVQTLVGAILWDCSKHFACTVQPLTQAVSLLSSRHI